MLSLTPVLNVEKIEPSLDFWEKGLGFERPMEVPGEGGLAFVMLKQGDIEVMYQTLASLEGEDPSLAEAAKGSSNFLYIKVESLDEVINNLDGFEVVVKRRQTFYGADEITYKEPGGHIVTFAQFKEEQ